MWPIETGGGCIATTWTTGSYRYDGAGNITRIGVDTFGYDRLGRLTSGTMYNGSTQYEMSYSYDSYGNMTQKREGLPGGSADALVVDASRNHLMQLDPPGLSHRSYVYDTNGNVVRDEPNVSREEFFYDSRNRMTAATAALDTEDLALARDFTYRYDARGYRVSKMDRLSGLTTFFARGPDGRTLSEFRRASFLSGTVGWDRDYLYANGQHMALLVNRDPGPPTGLEACSKDCGSANNDVFVKLTWDRNPDADLAGYLVYRTGPGGSHALNGGVPIPSSGPEEVYTDRSIANADKSKLFMYWVVAVDQAGRTGATSSFVNAIPVENEPPASVIA
jgi:YD repeat-containing protein